MMQTKVDRAVLADTHRFHRACRSDLDACAVHRDVVERRRRTRAKGDRVGVEKLGRLRVGGRGVRAVRDRVKIPGRGTAGTALEHGGELHVTHEPLVGSQRQLGHLGQGDLREGDRLARVAGAPELGLDDARHVARGIDQLPVARLPVRDQRGEQRREVRGRDDGLERDREHHLVYAGADLAAQVGDEVEVLGFVGDLPGFVLSLERVAAGGEIRRAAGKESGIKRHGVGSGLGASGDVRAVEEFRRSRRAAARTIDRRSPRACAAATDSAHEGLFLMSGSANAASWSFCARASTASESGLGEGELGGFMAVRKSGVRVGRWW